MSQFATTPTQTSTTTTASQPASAESRDALRADVRSTPGYQAQAAKLQYKEATAPAAPAADAVPEGPQRLDPLTNALPMVGKVGYKDERFLAGSGNLSKEEQAKLVRGDADITEANCSTFATWMLASAGYDVKAKSEGALGNLQAYININAGLSTGSLKGDIAADSNNIKGAAAGFVAMGIGVEVTQAQVKPGDFLQTWSKGGGGHSTIAHRVHCRGAAVFGKPGSPKLLEGETPAAGAAMGVGTPVAFVLDETTDPGLVGAHTVEKVEKLGAHLAGKNSEGKDNAAGVYTTKASPLSDHHKCYVGRLNDSRWLNWQPLDVAAWKENPVEAPAPAGGGAPAPAAAQEEEGWFSSVATWASDVGARGVAKGREVVQGVSELLFGAEETVAQADPTTAPRTETPAPEPRAFEAPAVRGCDYRVQPDGTIHYLKAGKVVREFRPDHQLHAKLKQEIVEAYPNMPY